MALCRRPRLLALAALLAARAVPCPAQPYYAVSVRGDTLGGDIAIWKVEADGQIALRWAITQPTGTPEVHVDPFGRYAIIEVELPDFHAADELQLWSVLPDHTMTLTDSYSEPVVGLDAARGTLSPDGRWLTCFARQYSGETEARYQAFRIGDDLQIDSPGMPLVLAPGDPLFSTGNMASGWLPSGTVVLNSTGNPMRIHVLHVSASGDVTRTGQVLTPPAGAASGLLAARQDGRVIVVTSGYFRVSWSLAVESSGEVEVVDILDLQDFAGLGDPHYAPSGLFVVGAGGFDRIDILRSGIFPGTWSSSPAEGADALRATISPDGRIALFNHRFFGSTSRLSTVFCPPRAG